MITTLNQLVAAMSLPPERIVKAGFTGEGAGGFHSSLYLAGRPGAGVAPSTGINGATLTSTGPTSPGYAGQIPFPAAVTGKEVRLARFTAAQTAGIGAAVLADRLWHNSAISVTTTTTQAITTPTWPARDQDAAAAGRGIGVALEVSTATGNGSPITTTTLSYTNSAGVAGRTATIPSFPATAEAGTLVPFCLQAGDLGIQSIQGITLGTSYVSGVIHLVAYREIADAAPVVAGVPDRQDGLGLGLPVLHAGSVPWLVYLLTATTAGTSTAFVQWAQG